MPTNSALFQEEGTQRFSKMSEIGEFATLKMDLWLPWLRTQAKLTALHPPGQRTYLLCTSDRVRVSLHQLLGSDCLRLRRTGDLEEQSSTVSMASRAAGHPGEQSCPHQRSFRLSGRLQGWFSCCIEATRAISVMEWGEGKAAHAVLLEPQDPRSWHMVHTRSPALLQTPSWLRNTWCRASPNTAQRGYT